MIEWVGISIYYLEEIELSLNMLWVILYWKVCFGDKFLELSLWKKFSFFIFCVSFMFCDYYFVLESFFENKLLRSLSVCLI